jgi:hypothetical protein
MPVETTVDGVAPLDALVGPLLDTCLHEFAHAIFEMLRVPVLGREEDAADQVCLPHTESRQGRGAKVDRRRLLRP